MVMAGPCCSFTEVRPGSVGALLLPESKLGRVTMELVLPPRTSTPGAAGEPVGAEPAPPGPGVGEIPERAMGSEPCSAPDFPAPESLPVSPLPGPGPWPMLEPLPEPPRPGLSPPEGDMARDPLPPVPGMPGLDPGSVDNTTPELSLLPVEPLGGARAEPRSPGPPSPEPLLPEPESPGPEPTEGGGGMTLLASRPPPPEPEEFRVLDPWPAVETDGGGGMTPEAPREEPWDRPEDEWGVPVAPPPTDGGGGITFVASELPEPPEELREVPAALTDGGGGTTALNTMSLAFTSLP